MISHRGHRLMRGKRTFVGFTAKVHSAETGKKCYLDYLNYNKGLLKLLGLTGFLYLLGESSYKDYQGFELLTFVRKD